MNYRECRAYVDSTQRFSAELSLDNIRELCARLGDPQDALKFIHVTGTNGKGSILAYVSTVLEEAGYRVGRYSSPAIFSYLEQYSINGEPMSEEAYARYVTQVAEAADSMERDGLAHPTPFELETAAVFLYFRDEKCDVVAMETGMGGLVDATNLITTTQVAVLTPISMDHMSYLGNTLREIAANKAGIIKPGCRVVTSPQEQEAMEVIRETCERVGVPLFEADPSRAKLLESSFLGQSFLFDGERYEIHLAGVYQLGNVVTAMTVLEALRECGYQIPREAVHRGLSRTVWGGRFSVIAKEPLFVIDGAHNPAAARVLRDSVVEYFSGKNLYYIMGMFRDKDYETVAGLTAKYAREIFTIATPDNDRALPAEELAQTVRKFNDHVTAMDSLEAAVDAAYEKAGEDDVIIAFGSLSFLGAITTIVKKRQESR